MLRLLVTFSACMFMLAACSFGGGSTPSSSDFSRPTATLERAPVRTSLLNGTPAPVPNVNGKFIFAPGDGSIWVQDPASGKPKSVIQPTPEIFADAPYFAPDGKSFVYIQSSLTAQGTAQNSIFRANQDGSQNASVAVPPNTKTAYNWPVYSADGKWIYFTSSFPVPPNQEHSEIDRIPAGGGTPQTIVSDGRMAQVSPDGKKIVFVRFNFDTFTGGLWVADIDGSNAKNVLDDQVFIMIAAPQFSPDSSEILFAASGPNTRPLPGIQSFRTPTSCEPAILCFLAQPAYADGLPWDLWTVTPDGSKFKRLTQVGADSPWPSWSADGKQIAFFDTSGQYLVDLTTSVVSQLNHNAGHGEFNWWSTAP